MPEMTDSGPPYERLRALNERGKEQLDRAAFPAECSWCRDPAAEWGVVPGRPIYAACASHRQKLSDLLSTEPGAVKRVRE